jgi:hypothetical protein
VLCWAGLEKRVRGRTYYSRVDVALINEQVRLFYSTHDEVEIDVSEDSFTLIEYVRLGINNSYKYYPLERVSFVFDDQGSYRIDTAFLFVPPVFEKKLLHHLYNANNAILDKLSKGSPLNKREQDDLVNMAPTYMLCSLNGFEAAKEKLQQLSILLKKQDEASYQNLKDTQRILRKIKYQ